MGRFSFRALAASIALAGFASISYADIIYYTFDFASKKTNWSSSAMVPKFDPSKGALLKVEFSLELGYNATMKLENLEDDASTIDTAYSLIAAVKRPNLMTIFTASRPITAFTQSRDFDGFDGDLDFAGDSGETYQDAGDFTSGTTSTSAVDDLTLFTGDGNIVLPVSVKASSSVSGSGNLSSFFSTFSDLHLKVIYTYIPEPATFAVLTLGAAALIVRRRRTA